MTTIRRLPLGPIQTNCYIVRKGNAALIIDPSDEPAKITQALEQSNVRPIAILLTHAHFDHIGALQAMVDKYSIPVYLHKAEEKWLSDPMKNGSGKYAELPNVEVAVEITPVSEGKLTLEGFEIDVLETPGHSPGSVSYSFKEHGFVVSGDVLFRGSIGRTDLIGGDLKLLMQSITRKLVELPEDTVVYSGHGEETTIQQELDTNPFLNGF
ncbi:glyoxylase-like metal-dependent hydrolase (beta-lactamase superfamily II) [Chryseomicrobium aureum]|uniref:MBL fold metallo-hydrolase n=1 Tax=Chryseomicrobium aureum TaxID=1441723 RepID=UPI00195A1279|nr:MBL fold metallo-hydrolase [Chryseomicrobium aureum]MBM7705726.1 glyoxylase-like metal-dependent hydrolase (beta-lactamase superfamily II) [Chryseomicrobium aureum]